MLRFKRILNRSFGDKTFRCVIHDRNIGPSDDKQQLLHGTKIHFRSAGWQLFRQYIFIHELEIEEVLGEADEDLSTICVG